MKNIEYLYNKNKGIVKIPHMKGVNVEYVSDTNILDFAEIKHLINVFSSWEQKFKNSKYIKYSIIYRKTLNFADKLSYILLECFLYDQIVNRGKDIVLYINNYKNLMITEGILYSCLRYTNDIKKFEDKFNDEISMYHFRKIVTLDLRNKKPDTLCILMSNIHRFLQTCGIDKNQAKQAAEMSVEIVDNALEHSNSDCLIDIDVSQRPYYLDNNPEEYIGVNIVVLDFSDKLLGQEIKSSKMNNFSDFWQCLRLNIIKEKHEKFFNSNYNENQFYMISAFQNKITSRPEKLLTGGKGLTILIKRLQESSFHDLCYVVSGDDCLFFKRQQIKQDDKDWVGFNNENSCELPPSNDALSKSPLHILGTAYNLSFVFLKGEQNEKN